MTNRSATSSPSLFTEPGGMMVRNGDVPRPAPRPSPRPGVAKLAGEAAVKSVKRKADRDTPGFIADACAFVLRYLRAHGETSGEFLTDACKAAGIRPLNDKQFGAVYGTLSRRKLIRCVRLGMRTKGHGTSGARFWEAVGLA